MTEIVDYPISPRRPERWAELWRGYLDFYETTCPTRSTTTPGSA